MKKIDNNDIVILEQLKQTILNQYPNIHTRQYTWEQSTEIHIVFNFYNGISSFSNFTQIYFTIGTNKDQNMLPKEIKIDRFLSEKVVHELIQFLVNDCGEIGSIQNSKNEITFSFPTYPTKENKDRMEHQTIMLHLDFYGCNNSEELSNQYLESIVHKFQKIKSLPF